MSRSSDLEMFQEDRIEAPLMRRVLDKSVAEELNIHHRRWAVVELLAQSRGSFHTPRVWFQIRYILVIPKTCFVKWILANSKITGREKKQQKKPLRFLLLFVSMRCG